MERGIVTSAHEIYRYKDHIQFRGGLPPEKLRYYTLYWDKFILVDSNIIGAGLSEEAQLLRDEGCLQERTERANLQGPFTGTNLADIHLNCLANAASETIKANPLWTIHQEGNVLILPDELSSERVTVNLELNRCLPVPKADVSLEDILEFKSRRADELLALRMSMDELYCEIVNSADIPRSKVIQVQKLEKAINDLDRVAKQSWGGRFLASRKVSLNLNLDNKSLGIGVSTGLIAGDVFSNHFIGIIAGATVAMCPSIKIEFSSSNQLNGLKANNIELSYLSSLKKENFVE